MKIKYAFANETVEIEVDEDWGNVLIDFDRQEYNNNQTQTRRHCSLEALNLDEGLLPSDVDVFADVARKADAEALYDAIQELEPQQQVLVHRVWFAGEKMADIAREDGVTQTALTNRMKRIFAVLEKKLK